MKIKGLDMDYTRLIDKVLVYIEANLCNRISLEDVADEVNLSCFHFHRIFSSFTGYTLKEYIRRRRLSNAGKEIIFTQTPLREIAGRYQFESFEAFIRAFRKEYQITPGSLRKSKEGISLFKALKQADIQVFLKQIKEDKGKETCKMECKIIEMKEMKVAGLKCTSTMKENTIPALWGEYNKIYDAIPDKVEGPCMGICVYTDMDVCTEDTPFEYIACHEVTTFDHIPDSMQTYNVPKGRYACFTHKGSLDTLDKTYGYIFGVWAKETTYEMDKRDQIEIYDERFKYGQDDSEMDILVPIK